MQFLLSQILNTPPTNDKPPPPPASTDPPQSPVWLPSVVRHQCFEKNEYKKLKQVSVDVSMLDIVYAKFCSKVYTWQNSRDAADGEDKDFQPAMRTYGDTHLDNKQSIRMRAWPVGSSKTVDCGPHEGFPRVFPIDVCTYAFRSFNFVSACRLSPAGAHPTANVNRPPRHENRRYHALWLRCH